MNKNLLEKYEESEKFDKKYSTIMKRLNETGKHKSWKFFKLSKEGQTMT